jgi:hypothetical protein
MNRECVEAADASEMSAPQITVAVCHNPNARWTPRRNRRDRLKFFITSTHTCGSCNSCQVPWHVNSLIPCLIYAH